MKKFIIQYIWIFIGVLLLDIGYYFFYLPTNLVTGGTMGISIIVKNYLPFSTSIFLYIVDGLLLIIGLIFLGKEFFIKTVYATILSPTIIFVFEHTLDSNFFFKDGMQSSYFVSAFVGGLLSAIGLGICFRNKGTTGGLDVVQKMLNKYLHIPYSLSMYVTDIVIVLLGGFFITEGKTYDIEMVVFGCLTVVGVGYVVDLIALNAKSRRTVYIITSKPLEIKQMIYDKIDRGVTRCDVFGGYTNNPYTMLICTMDRNETYRICDYIKTIDGDAFTFICETKEVSGNYEGIGDIMRKKDYKGRKDRENKE